MASACLFLMENYNDGEIVNIGTGEDVTIWELAETICRETGYGGKIEFDSSLPDGTPRKLLDVSRMNRLGWKASIGLNKGIRATIKWYEQHEQLNPVSVEHRAGR